ncbi:hypothetical protein JVX88_31375 [Leptolyngbya sp. 7M]|nr:hypothetical protein JVX88_31375 [Leptolyngbya sp. 7M]
MQNSRLSVKKGTFTALPAVEQHRHRHQRVRQDEEATERIGYQGDAKMIEQLQCDRYGLSEQQHRIGRRC